MLYLLSSFAEGGDFFNLFRYITFRAGGALVTGLLVGFIFGRPLIDRLKLYQKEGQPIREDGPESHKSTKAGTPTMGGLLIILALLASTLLWARLDNFYVWTVLLVTLGFGILGAIDDFKKLSGRSSKGLGGKIKLVIGFVIAAFAAVVFLQVHPPQLAGYVAVPVFKDFLIDFGLLFIPFVVVVIVGSANAVNLTDGLDGLAIVPVMIAASAFGIISYTVGRVDFTEYLDVHYVPGTGELLVLSAGLIGGGLGFLWYNALPAEVFMGDTGSLALGGAIGGIAVSVKHELVLIIIGGIFVIEALSVMIQVAYFKLTKKRIFLMSPIHHHFEKLGWAESQIVVRFWIIAIVLALAGLATLKVR